MFYGLKEIETLEPKMIMQRINNLTTTNKIVESHFPVSASGDASTSAGRKEKDMSFPEPENEVDNEMLATEENQIACMTLKSKKSRTNTGVRTEIWRFGIFRSGYGKAFKPKGV